LGVIDALLVTDDLLRQRGWMPAAADIWKVMSDRTEGGGATPSPEKTCKALRSGTRKQHEMLFRKNYVKKAANLKNAAKKVF
jgi:hypothetical protein